MIIATQYAAVKNRKLKEPFGPEDVKRACPGWAPRAYTNFLSKHAVGIPSKTTELFQFQRIGPGQYRTLPSLFDSKLGAGSRLEERRGILKNGFLYCCTRAEGYERRCPRCQNRSAHSCCNDLRYCRVHPIGLSLDHYFYIYAPVLGGVAASVGLFTYFFIVSVRRKRSWKNLLESVSKVMKH